MSIRKFKPLPERHPAVGTLCGICHTAFQAGDETTLIADHPADEEEKQKMLAGRPYTAEAILVHWRHYADILE